MTDPYTSSTGVDDIDDDTATETARLDAQADAILADDEMRTFEKEELPPFADEDVSSFEGTQPLRQAVREDGIAAREWGRDRVERLRGAVEEDPIKATLYALGIGVVIGLLAAR